MTVAALKRLLRRPHCGRSSYVVYTIASSTDCSENKSRPVLLQKNPSDFLHIPSDPLCAWQRNVREFSESAAFFLTFENNKPIIAHVVIGGKLQTVDNGESYHKKTLTNSLCQKYQLT